MVPTAAVDATLFHSGYCTAHSRIVNPAHGKGLSRFYAVWALLEHKDLGYILFDTGYSPQFHEATKRFPDRIYRWVTPVYVTDQQTAVARLATKGISPEQIRYVILSHFHADHIAGMASFTQATYICAKEGYHQFMNAHRWHGVFHGLLQQLAPYDFATRILFVEDIGRSGVSKEGIAYFDLFEKEDLRLVMLPGHAKAMMGMFLTINKKMALLATDAAWDATAFHKDILPLPIVKLFFDSWTIYQDTWKKLRLFTANNDRVPILFTHCIQTLNYLSHV